MEFSSEDLKQIKRQGLTMEEISRQLEDFTHGFPFMSVVKPATVGDGIKKYDAEQTADLVKFYDDNKDGYSITKFVPASGAATRMMKDFYSFLSEYNDEKSTPVSEFKTIKQAIDNIDKFAFYDLLVNVMNDKGIALDDCLKKKNYKTIIEFIVTDKGLNYGKSPKAWITFHKDSQDKHLMTAFEQHLKEAAEYASSNKNADIHFTVTEEHLPGFEKLKKELLPVYENKYGLKYNITLSFQEHSTDTIAVDTENNP